MCTFFHINISSVNISSVNISSVNISSVSFIYYISGLYKVEKYWYTVGLSNFGVYKFAMKRSEDQPPPPWEYNQEVSSESCVSCIQVIVIITFITY